MSDLHVHPMVVHFPVALFISALGMEICSLICKKDSLHRTAMHIYVLAAFLSPFAVWTGGWEEDRLHLHHPVLETHERFALLTMWASLLSLPVLWCISKRKPQAFRLVFIGLVCLAVTFVSLTAYNGGRMVYEYGIGMPE